MRSCPSRSAALVEFQQTKYPAENETLRRFPAETRAHALCKTNAEDVAIADSPSWRGYTAQIFSEWIGAGRLGTIHPDNCTCTEQQWKDALVARRFFDTEVRLRAPDAGWRWTNLSVAAALDTLGEAEKCSR